MKLLVVCLLVIGSTMCKPHHRPWGPPHMGPFGPPHMGPFGPMGPPPPPFLKDVDEDSRDDFMKIFENEELTRKEFKAQIREWAGKQNEKTQKAVADFQTLMENRRSESNKKFDDLINTLPAALQKLRALRNNEELTRKQSRKLRHDIIDDLNREAAAAAMFVSRMFRPRFGGLHTGFPAPEGPATEGTENNEVTEGAEGGDPIDSTITLPAPKALIGGPMGHGPRGFFPQPPFLKNVSEEAKQEFRKLIENEEMTKSDFKREVELWAERQGADVQLAVTKFERKMEEHIAEAKEKIQKLIGNLQPTFESIDKIRKDETLTRKQEFKQIRGIFDDLDRKEAAAVHFILGLYRPRGMPPPPPPPFFAGHRGPFGKMGFGKMGHHGFRGPFSGPFPHFPLKDDVKEVPEMPQAENFA